MVKKRNFILTNTLKKEDPHETPHTTLCTGEARPTKAHRVTNKTNGSRQKGVMKNENVDSEENEAIAISRLLYHA